MLSGQNSQMCNNAHCVLLVYGIGLFTVYLTVAIRNVQICTFTERVFRLGADCTMCPRPTHTCTISVQHCRYGS